MLTPLRTTPLTLKEVAQILPKLAMGFPRGQGDDLTAYLNLPIDALSTSVSLIHNQQTQWERLIASSISSLSVANDLAVVSFGVQGSLYSIRYSLDADNLGSIHIKKNQPSQGHSNDRTHAVELLKLVQQNIPL